MKGIAGRNPLSLVAGGFDGLSFSSFFLPGSRWRRSLSGEHFLQGDPPKTS